jgi:hypothetical protein
LAHLFLNIFIHSHTSCATIKIKWNEHEDKQTSGNRGGLTRRMLVSALSHDLVFKHYMSWSFFLFGDFRQYVIVRIVDIGGTVEHYCLSFFSIVVSLSKYCI